MTLPKFILLDIFVELKLNDLKNISVVCKRFSELFKNEYLWEKHARKFNFVSNLGFYETFRISHKNIIKIGIFLFQDFKMIKPFLTNKNHIKIVPAIKEEYNILYIKVNSGEKRFVAYDKKNIIASELRSTSLEESLRKYIDKFI